MKRYLLVNVGYNHLAVPMIDTASTAALMMALLDSVPVESKGYGEEQKWVPSSKEPPELKFVDGDKVTVGDDVASLKAQLADATREKEQYSKYWLTDRSKAEKLEKELKAIKDGVPPAPAPTPPPAPAVADDEIQF
jgi:hypothetical protein